MPSISYMGIDSMVVVEGLTISQYEVLERMLFDFARDNGNIGMSTRREMHQGRLVIKVPIRDEFKKVKSFIAAVVREDDICPTPESMRNWAKRHQQKTFKDGRPLRMVDMDSTNVEKGG